MSQDEKLNKNMSITFEFHVASDYISLTYQKKKNSPDTSADTGYQI